MATQQPSLLENTSGEGAEVLECGSDLLIAAGGLEISGIRAASALTDEITMTMWDNPLMLASIRHIPLPYSSVKWTVVLLGP